MPNLPTITVTDAQATRIQNAFGGVEEYKAWLRQSIKEYVVGKEVNVIRSQLQAQVEAKVAQVDTELNGI